MSIQPTREEFLQLTEKGNVIPVCRDILGDLDTPVSIYFRLSEGSKYAFLLESVEGEEKVARFSFIAADPALTLRGKGKTIQIQHLEDQPRTENRQVTTSPLATIREIMAPYTFVKLPGLPPFCGGLVGYIGYDVVRHFEHLPNQPTDDLNLPDLLLVLARNLIIFDHLQHKIKIISCALIPPGATQQEKIALYDRSLDTINKIVAKIRKPFKMSRYISGRNEQPSTARSNITEPFFHKIVKRAKRDIRAGEIIQVVLSQRFEADIKTDPINIYRALRTLNPSPYMFFLNLGDIQLIGSSPELLVRCEGRIVETRPIAGTRPRGKTAEADHRLMQELLKDPKERAEHIMLVDLGRNDLGRVCQKGSVKVSEFFGIEKYSHVMHIVSNVQGQLERRKDALHALEAAFPAGTLSGAPKVRAMEIIDELETTARGPYGGCIAYLSFSGNLDSCITIRTIVAKDGKAYVQAGAGIVADSVPKKEFQETVNKAQALLTAIEQAHAPDVLET